MSGMCSDSPGVVAVVWRVWHSGPPDKRDPWRALVKYTAPNPKVNSFQTRITTAVESFDEKYQVEIPRL